MNRSLKGYTMFNRLWKLIGGLPSRHTKKQLANLIQAFKAKDQVTPIQNMISNTKGGKS